MPPTRQLNNIAQRPAPRRAPKEDAMLNDCDLPLERALARLGEPLVTVISREQPRLALPDRWRLRTSSSIEDAADLATSDLVVIDAAQARREGIQPCREQTPAPIFVASEDSEGVARYLEAGADQCVGHSTTAAEWQARFEASVRAAASLESDSTTSEFSGSGLQVSLDKQQVRRGEELVDLTPREFAVLCSVLTAAPEAVSADRIAEHLWGVASAAARSRVRVYVARLRRKVEVDPTNPRVILTDGGSYRSGLRGGANHRRRTRVLIVGHDELRTERLRRELEGASIETFGTSRGDSRRCGPFDAVVAPADPVAIAKAKLVIGERGIPVVAVSERLGAARVIASLRAGASDVSPYPGRPGDLAARVQAAVRHVRAPGRTTASTLRTGALEIDLGQQRVASHGHEVAVSPTEYRLLSTLARRVDRVMSHEELLTAVWGPEYREETHYVRVYVRSLRAKLEDDPAEPRYVISEWGRGYRLAALPVEALKPAVPASESA
jgi:two-component system KDP operon response regulator KdpE